MKFIIDKAINGQYFYKIIGRNGQTMLVSETLANENDAIASIMSIQKSAASAVIQFAHSTRKQPGDTLKLTTTEFVALRWLSENVDQQTLTPDQTALRQGLRGLENKGAIHKNVSGRHSISEEGREYLARRA